MNIEIHLENNYFPWIKTEVDDLKCWLKGDLFYNDKILQESEIISLFSSLLSTPKSYNGALKNLLLCFNGAFALVIETPNSILCITDRIRSSPIFYSSKDHCFIIADDAQYLKERLHASLNQKNGAEFLVTGYVTGSDTLFDGVQQIQAGEYLIYDKSNEKYSVHRYFQYLHGNYSDDSEEQLIKRLDDVMVGVFNRLIDTTVKQDKTIVVPLSGGLDSRLIVAMLKRLGVENVICFSYGKKGNSQSEISRQVAEALGYTWYFVEYTNKRWYDSFHSEEMRAYELYGGNHVSGPHIQDYLAVKVMKEEGLIPDNAVFVPGHAGDMLTGSWISQDINKMPPNYDQFLQYILDKHYTISQWKTKANDELEAFFRHKIRNSVGDIIIHDADSLTNAIEFFNFHERQAKFIVNSVRVYEFFGYGWRIPYWDAGLMDFFLQIPIPLRMNQYLYRKYVLKVVFTMNLSPLSQIPCTTFRKYSHFASIKKYIIQKIPLIHLIRNKIVNEYSSHYLNWYSIMSEEDFKKWYTGIENINTYLLQHYIKYLNFHH